MRVRPLSAPGHFYISSESFKPPHSSLYNLRSYALESFVVLMLCLVPNFVLFM